MRPARTGRLRHCAAALCRAAPGTPAPRGVHPGPNRSIDWSPRHSRSPCRQEAWNPPPPTPSAAHRVRRSPPAGQRGKFPPSRDLWLRGRCRDTRRGRSPRSSALRSRHRAHSPRRAFRPAPPRAPLRRASRGRAATRRRASRTRNTSVGFDPGPARLPRTPRTKECLRLQDLQCARARCSARDAATCTGRCDSRLHAGSIPAWRRSSPCRWCRPP